MRGWIVNNGIGFLASRDLRDGCKRSQVENRDRGDTAVADKTAAFLRRECYTVNSGVSGICPMTLFDARSITSTWVSCDTKRRWPGSSTVK